MNAARARSTTKTPTTKAPTTATKTRSESGHQRNSTGASSSEIENLRFEALKGAYYHEGREAHFDWIHRFLLFTVTLSGTATASQLLASSPISPAWIGLVTAIVGLIDLVFNLSGKARDHSFLKRRFVELSSFCDNSQLGIGALTERLHSIYADEPPQFHCANAVAYNNAHRTIYDTHDDKLLDIPRCMSYFRNWRRYENYNFKRKNDASK
jgi:hypothetical protein